MRKILFLNLVMLFWLLPVAGALGQQKVEIRYEENYAEALKKVGSKKRDLLLVFCEQKGHPDCAKMDNYTLKIRQVCDFLNENFINVRMDVTIPEHENFIKEHAVYMYPTFLVLDKNGEEVGCFCGYNNPEVFLEKLQYATNPAHVIKNCLATFENFRTTMNAKACLEAYYQAGRIGEMVEFLRKIYYIFPPEDRFSPAMWKYVKLALLDVNSPIFANFLNEKYMANYYLGKTIVDETLSKAMRQYALWYVSGQLKQVNDAQALSLIGRLGLIDDQNAASYYIVTACTLYAQREITGRGYENILNYLSVEKVCALAEEDREFVYRFLKSIKGMPKKLMDNYEKEWKSYFEKQLAI